MTNEEVIELLQKYKEESEEDYYVRRAKALEIAIKALNAQKIGKWEIYVISMFDGEGCRCSECGFEGVPYWDFCPKCGARIDEVKLE